MLRDKLRKYYNGEHCMIAKEGFLEFVDDADYTHLHEAGMKFRTNPCYWVKKSLAEIHPWFLEV